MEYERWNKICQKHVIDMSLSIFYNGNIQNYK
nr:MAG TPA: hypothetical protein [Caudoviricetes sp.]DAO40617.1 MAG TPA: hypothetical protein [Caudoviricetes sp.]